MSNKTRKYAWPVSAVMAFALVAALAAFIVLGVTPGVTSAHDPDTNVNNHCSTVPAERIAHDVAAEFVGQENADGSDHRCATPGTEASGGNGGNGTTMPSGVEIDSSSTTGGAGVRLELTIKDAGQLLAGSSVELYLEDDFQVPDDINPGDVYFSGVRTGRVYVVDDIEIDDDDHFGGDDDWAIQVFVPDMNPGNEDGFTAWPASSTTTLNLVFTKAAGIKNPTEQGTHSTGYSVLGPDDEANDGPAVKLDDVMGSGSPLETKAKISLSDEDAGRGKEITVTGTGFNNGTNAEVRVLVDESGTAPSCATVMADGEKLGAASVGSDDKFTVTFTVHQDEFDAGAVNYICAADSEAGNPRPASAVKVFDLEASVTVSPASANFGDEVTLKPRDFVDPISSITLGPDCVWTMASGNDDCFDVEKDGSDYVFDLPGGLDERIQIAVTDGDQTKRIYMGVVPSSLRLSMSEVAPNASIIISGSGFTEDARVYTDMITIDGVALDVSNAGTQRDSDGDRYVQVTSNGEFTATVRIWTANSADSNPALDDDDYTIKAVDDNDFEGEATITILEPTVSVSPDTASPRDYIVISGENWPISTADDDNYVTIEVDGRTRNADVDGNGRFRYEYQLRSTIGIGDEHEVVVSYDGGAGGDIEEDTTFDTVEAELGLEPGMAAPGQTITVSVQGMPPYTLVSEVTIDGANRLGGRNINTDREGDATVDNILVPFLDPGFYPVGVKVGEETRVAQLEVLAEAIVGGVAAELPGAVSDLGDSLEAIFHFNNTSKEWTFFDPRPEFADLNTLSELNSGQPYWVLVDHSHEDVDWNGRLVDFTCAAGDCWNLEIW